jgi:hypothetical protein
MKIFFASFALIILAFIGYHLTFRKIRLPLIARKFYLTGTEYLFFGLILGPQFLNLLDDATCKGLAPLTALLLGWVGMLFGFQFELSKLRRFPLEYMGAALLEGGVTLAVIVGAAALLLSLISPSVGHVPIAAILCLGAASACTAQTGLALLAPEYLTRRAKPIQLLSYMSTMDGLLAVTIFALAYFYRGTLTSGIESLGTFERPLIALLVCIGLIVLYSLMTIRRCDEGELKLIVIGMTVITSGAATILDFSPLIANTVLGFGLVNFSRDKERIFQVLMSIEKPVYLILLVFLGVGWRFDSGWVLLMGAVLCGFRLVGKWLGGLLSVRLIPQFRPYPATFGFGLMDYGGLPLAILFDFQQRFAFSAVEYVVSMGLLAVIFTDILSPHLFGRLFKKMAHDATGAE